MKKKISMCDFFLSFLLLLKKLLKLKLNLQIHHLKYPQKNITFLKRHKNYLLCSDGSLNKINGEIFVASVSACVASVSACVASVSAIANKILSLETDKTLREKNEQNCDWKRSQQENNRQRGRVL